MKYITWLILSSYLLVAFTEAAWGFQPSASFTQSTLDNLEDAPIIPRVPQNNPQKIKLSRSPEETATRLAQEVSIQIANDIAYGLVIAHEKRQVRYGTRMYRKVQTAINLLRRGAGLDGASRRSGVPRPLLDKLMQWGQQRPGASRHHVE
ncbi:hypothetical protein VB715_10825 [Crocosphaera sp. UHCC 0190]|uniref:hypothetical protein n=1 Tax=Crocosphaera sp. UHCC 0190 TaxID=3110246 RepID=UPI002B1F7FAD|nr:hypothetical protein [Crocosphaera sp. UHCC 0190]MEA5510255.1 hypothetical protein [Crocosphaera sp. UHCC 0190]